VHSNKNKKIDIFLLKIKKKSDIIAKIGEYVPWVLSLLVKTGKTGGF